jgi:hypothetical protein
MIGAAPAETLGQAHADVKFEALFERDPCIALNHGVLHIEHARHRIDHHAAKLNEGCHRRCA